MATPAWVSSQKSHIWIFNVGRGLCIFIRTALNQGIMYDFGSSDEFRPSEFLKNEILPHLDKYKECRIAQIIISHPHADHISDIKCAVKPDLKASPFYSSLHTCPHDKTEGSEKPEAINWNRINNPPGSENNLQIYKTLFMKRTLPLQTICYDSQRSIPNLDYGIYYVRPPVVNNIYPGNDPKNNQEYANGTSIVLFYRHGIHTLLIPGDLNPDTFKHILSEKEGTEKRYTVFSRQQVLSHPRWHDKTGDQPSLRNLLKSYGLSVLIAPHHGLKSGYSDGLYQSIQGGKPGLVVVSEKRHMLPTDGEVDYSYQSANGAIGQNVFIEGKREARYSVSTRDGHHILVLFQGTSGQPEVYLEKDPYRLLSKLS